MRKKKRKGLLFRDFLEEELADSEVRKYYKEAAAVASARKRAPPVPRRAA